jgi:hypothetical protein
MSLKDFVIPIKTIQTPNGASFAVRGLSLNDITTLLNSAEPELRAMFSIFLGVDNKMQAGDLLSTAIPAMQQFPKLASAMIATAADEPDSVGIVERLPMSTQVEAMEAILQLSFDSEGGPGKFLGTVTRAFNGLAALTQPGTVPNRT